MPYEFITARGKLFSDQVSELKSKRGFTEETICMNRFFSAGEYLLEYKDELIKKFSTKALIESGVCVENDDGIQISPILLTKRIIIPYLDKNNKAYFIRPHKLGLSGVDIEAYQLKNLSGPLIILTEGEFKAVASCQMGYPALAIPGISSFSEKHFKRLVSLLKENNVTDIRIIFDNEIKNDPQYPNYKENPIDRWDTNLYAFYMCKKLVRAGFNSKISILPDSWRQKGKIDIDGALALGRSKVDLDPIITQALTHNEYLEQLPAEGRKIVEDKLKLKYFRGDLDIADGRYVTTRRQGKKEWIEPVSNFTIKITATHHTPEGLIREAKFINEFGDTSKSFPLPPKPMSKLDQFREFCLTHGNYLWFGNWKDMCELWEALFLEDDGIHITQPDHIGFVANHKLWLFGNVAIKGSQEIRPDKNKTFWINKHGIKPFVLNVNNATEGIPHIALEPRVTLGEIRSKFSDTIGVMQASVMLGWTASVIFMEEVFEKINCFPFLFITGRRGTGKSTIAEWGMNFFGLENSGKMASDTTPVAIQRYLSYCSCLPVYIDEYRNTKQITYKNGFLRNVYNRQSAGKGTKTLLGVREAKIRGTLLISGEETPEDNALLTRCVVVTVSEKERKENHYNWFMANRTHFSWHILNLIKNKDVGLFLEILENAKKYFLKHSKADDRTAVNYAVVAAGYYVLFGESADFENWLINETTRVKEENNKEQAVDVFLEGLLALQSAGQIQEKNYWEVQDGMIYLYFHGLYLMYAEKHNRIRGDNAFKASALRDYLKCEDGFSDSGVNHRLNGNQRTCLVFDALKAPKTLRMLVGLEY